MAIKEPYSDTVWSKYYGPNLGYIQERYDQFVKDPSSVEQHYRDLFTVSGPPLWPRMRRELRLRRLQPMPAG